MMLRNVRLLGLYLVVSLVSDAGAAGVNERELYIREAFYHAVQGDLVEAISRADIAFDRVEGSGNYPSSFRIGDGVVAVGDFERAYRMRQRAVQRAAEVVIERYADDLGRNEAAYYLARLLMEQGEPGNALKAIRIISGKIPEDIREDEVFLRARIYMANGEYAGAVRLLQKLQDSKGYKVFAVYDLGIALILLGQEQQGIQQLEKAGKISSDDEVAAAVRDKANLTLGSRMLKSMQPERAKLYFSRVRLDGPYSNKAMLGVGMADVAREHFEEALATWTVLSGRDLADEAVQESMLGIPFAYARLSLPGKATTLYGKALEEFDRELKRLDAAVRSVREGKLLKALSDVKVRYSENWIAPFRDVMNTPETPRLMDSMGSPEFEVVLKNYWDMKSLIDDLSILQERLNASFGKGGQHLREDDERIRQLGTRMQTLQQRGSILLNRQGQAVEKMVITELERRRKQVQEYRAQASVGLIENYERASRSQASQGRGK